MKKEFTKEELLQGRGCYSKERINKLFPDDRVITIEEILNQDVPIKDKRWFVYNSCELSLNEKSDLSLKLAQEVLPIYEEKYPEDSRVRECLQGIEDFKNGVIDKSELIVLRHAAYAAYAAAAAYAAYAAAAYAAAAAAAAVVTDAAAAYAATDAAAYAASAAAAADAASKTLTYSEKLLNILIEFFK